MEMNYCRRCGSPLKNAQAHVFTCDNSHTIFANTSPTVGVFFITNNNSVLLSRRGIEPHKGMLDSFGGFVDGEESFELAAQRELIEELNLTSSEYEPLHYLTSAIGHYPYKNEVIPILSTFFWTRLTTTRELTPLDDVAEIVELPLHDIDLALLHDDDIRAGITKLQQQFNTQPEEKL